MCVYFLPKCFYKKSNTKFNRNQKHLQIQNSNRKSFGWPFIENSTETIPAWDCDLTNKWVLFKLFSFCFEYFYLSLSFNLFCIFYLWSSIFEFILIFWKAISVGKKHLHLLSFSSLFILCFIFFLLLFKFFVFHASLSPFAADEWAEQQQQQVVLFHTHLPILLRYLQSKTLISLPLSLWLYLSILLFSHFPSFFLFFSFKQDSW